MEENQTTMQKRIDPRTLRLNEMEKVSNEIARWFKLQTLSDFVSAISARVIGQPGIEEVCANIQHYLLCLTRGVSFNGNMLIAASSGNGKTETYRAISDYFAKWIPDIPIVLFDLTQVTPTGYRGANIDDALIPFYSFGDPVPPGLLFLDEFDKRITGDAGETGRSLMREVQENLLSMLEGAPVVSKKGDCIYTNRICFFGLGSFDAFRDRREDIKHIGFGAADEHTDRSAEITREDILKAGGMRELVGRFPFIVNYGPLSEKAMEAIIMKELKKLGMEYGVEVRIAGRCYWDLVKRAGSPFGIREVKGLLQGLFLKCYYEWMTSDDQDRHAVFFLKNIEDAAFYPKDDPYMEEYDKRHYGQAKKNPDWEEAE